MDRRNFGRFGIAAIGSLVLAEKLLASGPAPVCDVSCGGSGLDSNVINYHNVNIAPAYAQSLSASPSRATLQSAAVNHLDQWNYYVSTGCDQDFQASLRPTNYSLTPAVIQSVTNQFISYKVPVSSTAVQNLLTVSSAAITTATSYSNSVGLTPVMNSVYSYLSSFASGTGSQQASDCQTYDALTNILAILAVIYGASSVVLGPVGSLAGAGFGLVAGILRFERPVLSC